MYPQKQKSSKVDPSCFYSWEEWIYMCELLCPNIPNIKEIKQSYEQLKNIDSLYNVSQENYYSFLLKQLLNTKENLSIFIHNSSLIMNRNTKNNPVALIATYDLLNHYINLNNNEGNLGNIVYKAILLDILRTTSHLSDIYQSDAKFSKSINKVLESLNMKEHELISEVRHMATHKHLPPLILAKKSIEYLLVFFLENYWAKIYFNIIDEIPKNKIENFKKNMNELFSINDNNNFQINNNNFSLKFNEWNWDEKIENKIKTDNKICDKIRKKNIFFTKNFRTFKSNLEETLNLAILSSDYQSLIKTFSLQIHKNLLRCGIFFSELLKNLIKYNLASNKKDNNDNNINENILNMFKLIIDLVKNKKSIRKLFKYPFIKIRILKIISLKSISKNFQEFLDLILNYSLIEKDELIEFKNFDLTINTQIIENNNLNISSNEIEEFFITKKTNFSNKLYIGNKFTQYLLN